MKNEIPRKKRHCSVQYTLLSLKGHSVVLVLYVGNCLKKSCTCQDFCLCDNLVVVMGQASIFAYGSDGPSPSC